MYINLGVGRYPAKKLARVIGISTERNSMLQRGLPRPLVLHWIILQARPAALVRIDRRVSRKEQDASDTTVKKPNSIMIGQLNIVLFTLFL